MTDNTKELRDKTCIHPELKRLSAHIATAIETLFPDHAGHFQFGNDHQIVNEDQSHKGYVVDIRLAIYATDDDRCCLEAAAKHDETHTEIAH